MTCGYCGGLNSSLDHRCGRCGRRLYEAPVSRSSPALAIEPDYPPPPVADGEAPRQEALFASRELIRESPRVVQMPARRPAPAVKVHSYRKPGNARGAGQQRLEFPTPELPKMAEPSLANSDATVALPVHRTFAAALDGSMVAITCGLILIVAHLAGVAVPLNKSTAPYVALCIFLTLTIYRLIWCLADVDSIGMRWAGLRLVNFDCAPPNRGERVHRMVASCISAAAAGLGLAWALVDEERLTWHDHMSKTFPSPVEQPRRVRPAALRA